MRTYTKALLTKASNMITLLLLPVTITRKRTTIAASDSVLRDGSIISWIDFVVLRRRMIMSEGFEPYIAYTESGRHKWKGKIQVIGGDAPNPGKRYGTRYNTGARPGN
jgi:hypothetical protein